MYLTLSRILRGMTLLAVTGSTAITLAQSETLREREKLDPSTGQWVAEAPAPLGTPEGDLRAARQALVDGKARRAHGILDDWIEANEGHPRYFEAVYLFGDAYFDLENYYAAYLQYEIVVNNTSGDLYRKALRREMDVARAFLSGEKRIVWKTVRLPAYDDGVTILDRIWERVPGTRLGEEALLLKADYFFEIGDPDLAQDEYGLLAQEYPKGRYHRQAMLRSAESAERSFPGVRYDDRALVDADDRYALVEKTYPKYAERERVAARRVAIRDQRAEKDLSIADWYLKTENPSAAEFYYRAILNDWPGTFAAQEARTRLLGLGVNVEGDES